MFSSTIARGYFSSKDFGTVKAATPIYFLLTYRLINDVTDASGGATVIKMVRQNRGAAGAEASAEGTRMEAP